MEKCQNVETKSAFTPNNNNNKVTTHTESTVHLP